MKLPLNGWPKKRSQNHPLLYATHQLMNRMGIVATSPHIKGKAKSAMSPRTIKIIQKIFFSTSTPRLPEEQARIAALERLAQCHDRLTISLQSASRPIFGQTRHS